MEKPLLSEEGIFPSSPFPLPPKREDRLLAPECVESSASSAGRDLRGGCVISLRVADEETKAQRVVPPAWVAELGWNLHGLPVLAGWMQRGAQRLWTAHPAPRQAHSAPSHVLDCRIGPPSVCGC